MYLTLAELFYGQDTNHIYLYKGGDDAWYAYEECNR